MTRSRAFSIFILVGFVALVAFAFSPYELGTLRDYRIIVYFKYWRWIDPSVVNPEALVSRLRSKDTRLQIDAAQSIGFLEEDPKTVKALMEFLGRPDVEESAKDVAVWSLGELRIENAMRSLLTLRGDERYNQKNLQRAIDKIEGRIEKSIWPE